MVLQFAVFRDHGRGTDCYVSNLPHALITKPFQPPYNYGPRIVQELSAIFRRIDLRSPSTHAHLQAYALCINLLCAVNSVNYRLAQGLRYKCGMNFKTGF